MSSVSRFAFVVPFCLIASNGFLEAQPPCANRSQPLQSTAIRTKETLASGEYVLTSTKDKAPPKGRAALPESSTSWIRMPTEAYPGKQDDIYFVNSKTGWYVNGAGKIFKTIDGGSNWELKLHKPGTYFRCISFIDEKRGFAGNIGPGYFPNVSDDQPLYRTNDGGENWTAVTSIEGPKVVGLCSLEVVRIPFVNAGNLDHKTRIVGVGRVGGPTAMIVSDDLGETWQQRKLPESCAMAFDVHFVDANHGFIASATSSDVQEARALILATEDGGQSWKEVFQGSRSFELTWKIAFPTQEVGYVTIQSYNPDPQMSKRYVAKTIDGGKTWSEIELVDDAKVRQFGIAFVDANRGWIGAMPGGFETTDGGKTWTSVNFGNAVNKIRVVEEENSKTLFAIGVQVHKLELHEGKE